MADLATKMHSKMRLWELLRLWGFKDLPEEAVQALNTKGLYLAMLAMAMLITPVDASSTSSKASLSTVDVDELLLVTVLVCVTAVVAWEAIKGVCRYLVGLFRETPKQRRLRKLREAAKAAAEEEVDKAFVMKHQDEEPLQGPEVVPPPPPEPHPVRRLQPSKKVINADVTAVFENEYDPMPSRAFYKTNSVKSKLHTDPHCSGLRNAGDVYAVEYCAYCQNRTPLYTRRSRSLQPTRSF